MQYLKMEKNQLIQTKQHPGKFLFFAFPRKSTLFPIGFSQKDGNCQFLIDNLDIGEEISNAETDTNTSEGK